MSMITDLYDYFLTFPQLKKLLPITSDAERGKDIFFPRGSSSIYNTENERIDVLGNYSGVLMPYPSIFEDWQMNLFRGLDTNDETQDETNYNIENYDEVEKICKEILTRNAQRVLPKYDGAKVFAIVPTGTKPTIWGTDMTKETITYAITIRVYYVNPNPRIEVEFDEIDDSPQ